MQLNLSDDEVKAIRRINARIQGTIGGQKRTPKQVAAAKRNQKKAVAALKAA